MDIERLLSERINMPQIKNLADWVLKSKGNRNLIWGLVKSENIRVSVNAIWILTHLPYSELEWLTLKRDEMIDMLLSENHVGKKRMLLQLLRDQEYHQDNIRTDFLDFCMSKINSLYESYAVRCFSIYIAFKMCRHYPELITELENHLDMMALQNLSPGLKSALRQTRDKIYKLNKLRL